MKTRWFDVRVPRVLPLAVCLLVACRPPLGQGAAVTSSGAHLSQVPAQAPDTLPAWTLHDSSYAGHYLKSVLTINFKPTASLVDRRALIASLNGVVIGGVGSQVGEGDYYVLLPGHRTVTAIDSIATALATDPRVEIVSAAGRRAEKQLHLP